MRYGYQPRKGVQPSRGFQGTGSAGASPPRQQQQQRQLGPVKQRPNGLPPTPRVAVAPSQTAARAAQQRAQMDAARSMRQQMAGQRAEPRTAPKAPQQAAIPMARTMRQQYAMNMMADQQPPEQAGQGPESRYQPEGPGPTAPGNDGGNYMSIIQGLIGAMSGAQPAVMGAVGEPGSGYQQPGPRLIDATPQQTDIPAMAGAWFDEAVADGTLTDEEWEKAIAEGFVEGGPGWAKTMDRNTGQIVYKKIPDPYSNGDDGIPGLQSEGAAPATSDGAPMGDDGTAHQDELNDLIEAELKKLLGEDLGISEEDEEAMKWDLVKQGEQGKHDLVQQLAAAGIDATGLQATGLGNIDSQTASNMAKLGMDIEGMNMEAGLGKLGALTGLKGQDLEQAMQEAKLEFLKEQFEHAKESEEEGDQWMAMNNFLGLTGNEKWDQGALSWAMEQMANGKSPDQILDELGTQNGFMVHLPGGKGANFMELSDEEKDEILKGFAEYHNQLNADSQAGKLGPEEYEEKYYSSLEAWLADLGYIGTGADQWLAQQQEGLTAVPA